MQAVASGELDVAVCFNVGDDRRIDGTQVFEEDICLVGVPEPEATQRRQLAWKSAFLPTLTSGRDHILRGMIDRVALFRNRPINVRYECLSLHALFAGLRLGLGATLISQFSALPSRDGDVLCRPISEPVVTRQLFIRQVRAKTTAQKTVVRTVKTSYSRTSPLKLGCEGYFILTAAAAASISNFMLVLLTLNFELVLCSFRNKIPC